MTEYLPVWNGMKKGDKCVADGQPCTFVHAAVADGVVKYLMVVSEYRNWYAVQPDEVVPTKRGKK